ncbi:MAG: MBL fold metallo-hydrolase [Clostridia bacterium]
MILKRIKVNAGGFMGINCYIIQDEETKETMVIDPGGSFDKIEEMLNVINAKVKYILLTHCHGDHMGAATILREKYGGKILIHRFDRDGLRNPSINLSSHIGIGDVIVEEDARVDDGDILHVGGLKFKVIYTPGHTIGSISLYCEEEKMLFSGDTLFRGSWGRTDLPTSNFEQIINSITDKLMKLPEDTIVYPGHRKINNNKRRRTNILGAKSKRF